LLLVLHTRDDDCLFLCVANTALRAEDAVVVRANIIIQKREREKCVKNDDILSKQKKKQKTDVNI
jgi:hypothetical protein